MGSIIASIGGCVNDQDNNLGGKCGLGGAWASMWLSGWTVFLRYGMRGAVFRLRRLG
jgi:hypothetical protein